MQQYNKQTVKRIQHTVDKSGNLKNEEPLLLSICSFDDAMNLIHEQHFSHAEISQESFMKYENNLCVEEKLNHIEDDVSETILYIYNSSKKVQTQIKKYEFGSERIEFTYDSDLLIKRETFDDDGNLEANINFEYENGILKSYHEFSFGELQLSKERTFENGVPAFEKQWNIETSKTIHVKYTSFVKDLEPSYNVYDANEKLIERIEREYNSNNKMTSESIETTFQGYTKMVTEFVYDGENNLLESITKNVAGDIVSSVLNTYENGRIKCAEHFEKVVHQSTIVHYTDEFFYE